MILPPWEKLPPELQLAEIRPYYDVLKAQNKTLMMKRLVDIIVSGFLFLLFLPLFLLLALAIKLESEGPVFFRQERITQFGRHFRIFKFRSMVMDAEQEGHSLTVGQDHRITHIGKIIRKYRMDEIAQLLDVFRGTMTFVGTRPEIPKYVAAYTAEMKATLLLPAGVTSEASIRYKDEDALLEKADDVDDCYINHILPDKMKYNLSELKHCGPVHDLKIMLLTLLAMAK